jgi:hypothetical protein
VSGPFWLAGGVAAAMIATAVYCVSRMWVAWRWRRPTDYDVDGVHALMGVGMAGMLVPRLNPAAGGAWDVGGAAVFGAAMAWFGWRAVHACRDRQAGPRAVAHNGQHLLASGAMLYMFLAIPSAGTGGLAAGAAMAATGARIPTFALLLAVGLFGYVIWTTDGLTSLAPATVTVGAGGPPSPASPAPAMSLRLAACCEIVMGVAMGYMLITML